MTLTVWLVGVGLGELLPLLPGYLYFLFAWFSCESEVVESKPSLQRFSTSSIVEPTQLHKPVGINIRLQYQK